MIYKIIPCVLLLSTIGCDECSSCRERRCLEAADKQHGKSLVVIKETAKNTYTVNDIKDLEEKAKDLDKLWVRIAEINAQRLALANKQASEHREWSLSVEGQLAEKMKTSPDSWTLSTTIDQTGETAKLVYKGDRQDIVLTKLELITLTRDTYKRPLWRVSHDHTLYETAEAQWVITDPFVQIINHQKWIVKAINELKQHKLAQNLGVERPEPELPKVIEELERPAAPPKPTPELNEPIQSTQFKNKFTSQIPYHQ